MKRALALTLILGATTAIAQTETTKPAATATAATTTSVDGDVVEKKVVVETDSTVVRQQFREILERHPNAIGRVLKTDPTLFSNQAWLANYPSLSAFLRDHPEIAHSPNYYLDSVYIPGDAPPSTASERVWHDMMEGLSIFFAFGLAATVLTWLIRTLIDHRRWSRISKVQAEVHNKILDRFASNEDLLKYVQTTAGKRFLESAPMQLEPQQARPSAPVQRILWSVQIGVVLGAGGIGFLFVSRFVPAEGVQPMVAFGIIAMSIGIGFVASSFVSYVLSRRLGLWDNNLPEPSRESAE